MPFIERSHWGLHFFFLHSWALSSFSGHYDQRTWKFYDEFHHFPVKYPPDIEHSRQWTLVCISVILIIERYVKTSNRQVSWISLTSRLCKHYLFQWTGHNVASSIGKQYCLGMQRISQFSWCSDAVRIFKVQLYISQKPAGFGYKGGILGFKENMTRIQWYVDLIDCAFFSNLFGLTIPITFHNIWCLVKKGMTDGSFHTNTYDIPKTLLELDPDLCTLYWFKKNYLQETFTWDRTL